MTRTSVRTRGIRYAIFQTLPPLVVDIGARRGRFLRELGLPFSGSADALPDLFQYRAVTILHPSSNIGTRL